jgi:hypothetical protein
MYFVHGTTVDLEGEIWEEAFAQNWRKTKAWQPGWEYEL